MKAHSRFNFPFPRITSRMSTGKSSLRRECVALTTLVVMFQGQIVLPLSTVWAQSATHRGAAAKSVAPKSLTKNRATAASNNVQEESRKPEFSVTLAPVDTSKVPSQAELMAAGGLTGPLAPLGNADVNKYKEILTESFNLPSSAAFDRAADEAEAASAALGLGKRLPLVQAKEKIKRLEEINLSFGNAINYRNTRKFAQTARLMREHLEKYPDSPWAGEAMLHLSLDALSNGRPAEAQARLQTLMDNTVEDREDPTWEIRCKTKATWANLDLTFGQWGTAIPELEDIIRTDDNPHRRTWALSWLAQAKQLTGIRKANLLACGSEALGVMLASVDAKASKQVEGLTPPNSAGFTLEEMARIAKRQGVSVKGFKIVSHKTPVNRIGATGQKNSVESRDGRVEQLANLPLPLIVHFDMAKYAGQTKNSFGLKPRGAAWTSQSDSKINKTSTQVERQLAAARPHCDMCLPTNKVASSKLNQEAKTHVAKPLGLKSNKIAKPQLTFQPRSVGHYLIVRRIDKQKSQVRLEDPTAHTAYTLTFDQLEKEWSGVGLAFAPEKSVPVGVTRIASLPTTNSGLRWLAKHEMSNIRGGCCCAFTPPGGSGPPTGPPGANPPSPGPDPCPFGSPVMQVNPVTNNLYISDIPIWYSPAVGPGVQMTLAYNSQDTGMYSTFGANWRLSFGSSLVENPGGQVFVSEGDGSSSVYVPNVAGNGYVSEAGNFNVLTKTSSDHFEVTTLTGEKMIYDKPRDNNNVVLNVPTIVLNEIKDRFGYSLKVRYETYSKTIGSAGYTALLTRITRVIDAQGKISSLSYNSNGYCTRISDPFGRQARFEYNSAGQMSKAEDMGGDSFVYAYDANNLVSSVTTAQGVWNVKFQFPSAGYNQTIDPYEYFDYITKITPPGQQPEYYRLDTPGFIYTDANGHQTLYKSEDSINNRPVFTRIIKPDETQTTYTYNHANGHISSVTNALGEVSQFFYNALGNITASTNANGHTSTLIYYPNGIDVKEVRNANNDRVMSATYDSNHLVATSTSYPTAALTPAFTTSFNYTAWGALSSTTNPKGETTSYIYDGTTSRLSGVQRSGPSFPARTVAAFTYDSIGRVLTATDAFGATRQMSYNDLDKPTKITYGDGSQEITDYVCCRLPGVTIDRSNRKTYYDYDEGKRLRRVQDANGNTLQIDYDAAGNMTTLLDGRGSLTRWEYDANDRVTRKTYPDGSRQGYAYDAAGRLTRSYDGRGLVTKFEYDAVGNLTKIDYPTSTDETFNYDNLDRLVGMSDKVGVTQWTYDLMNRTTSENGPWSDDYVAFGYNNASQRTNTNVGGIYATNFTYDAIGRLTDVSSPASSSTTNSGWHWDYDSLKVGNSSLPSQLTQPNGTLTKYNWQAPLERLKDIKNYKSDGTTLLSQFVFGFDDVNKRDARLSQGRQMRGTDNVMGSYQTINYGYDATDQLLAETSNETVPEVKNSFVLDSMGNRNSWKVEGAGIGGTTANNIRNTGSSNRINQLTSVTTLATDNSSTTTTRSFEARGNLARTENNGSDRYALYYFDDANRLEKVLWQKRADQPVPYQNISQSIFYYDGMSRRRRVIEQNWNTGTSSWTTLSDTTFVYSGLNVIQERDTLTNTVRVNLTRIGNVSGILARQTYTSAGVLDKTLFYHYDGSGDVVQTTDSSQNVQSAYWYDAFGKTQKVSENTGYSQPYRFSTKWQNDATGLYDFGYRFYDSSSGTWLNRDPLGEVGGKNLYGFVGNNPTNLVDPRGLQVEVGHLDGPSGFAPGDNYGTRPLSPAHDIENNAPGMWIPNGNPLRPPSSWPGSLPPGYHVPTPTPIPEDPENPYHLPTPTPGPPPTPIPWPTPTPTPRPSPPFVTPPASPWPAWLPPQQPNPQLPPWLQPPGGPVPRVPSLLPFPNLWPCF